MANNGRHGELLFKKHMELLGMKVEDLSKNPDYFDKDIDFKVTNPNTGASRFFEVKWDSRINRTGNLFIEINNIHSKGGLGWFEFCQADFIAYGDTEVESFYVFRLDELKECIAHCPLRTAFCGQDSEGYLVPLDLVSNFKSFYILE